MNQRKMIFLDRDGILNTERGTYTFDLAHFSMVEGIGSALKSLKDKGYGFAVVTNQGGITKGIYAREEMHQINQAIARHLSDFSIDIEEFYYCPHHTDFGRCLCRKPDSLLLEKAIARSHAAVDRSWFIGDKERDMEAGRKAGLQTFLLPSNESLIPHLHLFL
mgnify:CR=1 FL=1